MAGRERGLGFVMGNLGRDSTKESGVLSARLRCRRPPAESTATQLTLAVASQCTPFPDGQREMSKISPSNPTIVQQIRATSVVEIRFSPVCPVTA